MSISKFREFIEKPGCAYSFGLLMVLVMGWSIFTGSCNQQRGMEGPGPTQAITIAKVGDFPIYEQSVWEMVNQNLASFSQQLQGPVSPGFQATIVGGAIEQQISAGLLVELAKRKGVTLDDAAIDRATEMGIDEALQGQKDQLITMGKLKADASPAVVDSVLKKETGKDAKEFREAVLESYRSALTDPIKRNQIVVSTANTLVMEKLAGEVSAPESLIRSFYDIYNCKRIFLKNDLHKGEDLLKKAESILKEVKGGLSFEAAMDKYTDDPPDAGKKKSENVYQVDGKTAALNDAYSPITKLKPGELGGPYTLGDGGVTIVKFVSKSSEAPADLQQNKAKYSKDYQRDSAAKVLQDELKKLREQKDLIKWESPGYQTFFDLMVWRQEPATLKLDPKARRAKLDEFVKRAEEAKNDNRASRIAPLAMFSAFEEIWSLATDAQKAELTPKRIEVLQEILQTTESSELRLELADLLATKKDGAAVSDNLRFAATAIASDFGQNGQRIFQDIQSRLLKFKSAGILNAEQEQNVRSVLDQWRKDKAQSEQYEKEQKEQEEKMRKEAEAAQKKAEAEKAKSKPKGK